MAFWAFARPKSKLSHIAAERAVCIEAYRAARNAGDTRAQSAAYERLQRATALELQAFRATANGWRGR